MLVHAKFHSAQLLVYRKSLALIRDIDPLIAAWPSARNYLKWQGWDAFSSVGLNIAEASYDFHPAEQCRFFNYARRSGGESVGVLDQALVLGLNTESDLALSTTAATRSLLC